MKSVLPFCAFVVLLASCTTAYKAGQTPDDVYFSPARPHDEYVRTENRQDKYQYDEQNDNDRYLRMKVRNRRTWSDLDYYYSDPYAYNYNYHNRFNTYGNFYNNTPWNNYSSWNYYYNPYNNYYGYNGYSHYNPYGSRVIIVDRKPPVYNRPRTFNLNTYNAPNTNANDPKSSSRRVYRGDNRNYNTTNDSYNSNNNSRTSLREVFGTNNSSSSNTSTRPTNTTPARSEQPSRPSSSSSSSSNAPVRKF
jgi:hypothetical protein